MKVTDQTETCLTCWWSSLNVDLEVRCYNPDIWGDLLTAIQADHGPGAIGGNCGGYQLHPFLQPKQQQQ